MAWRPATVSRQNFLALDSFQFCNQKVASLSSATFPFGRPLQQVPSVTQEGDGSGWETSRGCAMAQGGSSPDRSLKKCFAITAVLALERREPVRNVTAASHRGPTDPRGLWHSQGLGEELEVWCIKSEEGL